MSEVYGYFIRFGINENDKLTIAKFSSNVLHKAILKGWVPLLFIIAVIIILLIIYIAVLKVAFLIVEFDRKTDKKRFNCELDDYDLEKKLITLYVTAFFIILAVGLIYLYFTI